MQKGFKIIRSEEPLEARPVVITLYGQPGLGKTSISFSMPTPLHLDFDRGISRAVQKIRPDSISVTDFGVFWDFIFSEDIEREIRDNGYESLILDTGGSMIDDFMSNYVTRIDSKNRTSSGGLSLAGWGVMGNMVNSMRNRFVSLGLHLCILAHDKDLGDDSPVRVGLSVKGQSSDLIARISDQLGYVQSIGGKRIIDFNHSQKHLGKDTGRIGSVQIPDFSKPEYDTFLVDILTKVQHQMVAASSAQVAANEIVDSYRDGIESCNTPKSFEEMSAKIGSEKNQFVLIRLRQMMKDQMAAVGIEYDKETSSFVEKSKADVES